jgi:hypothetical protein
MNHLLDLAFNVLRGTLTGLDPERIEALRGRQWKSIHEPACTAQA